MPKNFNYWKKQHDGDQLNEFNTDCSGTLWLKLKSIVRRDYINKFAAANSISLNNNRLTVQFIELYSELSKNIQISHQRLNDFIKAENANALESLNINNLVQELYKVDSFKWGADNQNDLGKYLVKKYVKDNRSYNYLIQQMESGIISSVQDYLICSWYNHWSSILIEHTFKTHDIVLPTVGKIKGVDFFINEIPFDLKVTYLPVNFIEHERKIAGLRPELTCLKQYARAANISFDNNDSNLYYSLTRRIKDKGGIAIKVVNEIRNFRLNLIERVKENPLLLAKNLYENQSDFRFGAENRMFLILIDKLDFDNSWQLKRNIDLLQPRIHSYLDEFCFKDIRDLKLEFYKGGDSVKFPKKYEVLTDVIVIEKEN